MSFFICHYVILSYKNHQFLPVTLLFCLQKNICLSLSLCHYVFKKASVSLRHSVILSSKKTSVSFRHSVILSSKKHLSPSVLMLFCLQKNICLPPSLCYSVFQKNICLPLSLCHSVFKKTSVSLRHSVILSKKNICLPLSLCHYVFKKNICLLPSLCYSVFKKKICLPLSLCHYVFKKTSVSLSVPLLFCLKTPQLGTEAGPAVVVVISFLSVLYQYFISCATSSPTTFLQYILFDKVVEITSCGIL